jgi:hypothetical protein
MRKRAATAAILVLVLGAGGFAASAAVTAAPPGATALCRDGTYSFSKTHSGSCSHHGGVASWLSPATTSATTTAASPGTSVNVGHTVLVAPRTQTSRCRLGANPDPDCSPGASYSGLTRAVLCSSSFRTSSIRHVPTSEKHAVEHEYGMAERPYGTTLEIDHIVSLELGGSNDIANLYPERAPGFHTKDRLENRLHALVCAGEMTLRAAQFGIATNWQGLYATVFLTTP